MQFSKLRLNGFKSFVDPTELVIADGLTGIVGPNGCGKSNLLEALRWVMGENRAKSMRGSGMEDVIFAGAASRPARNFAEVSLSIDNTERLAPSGFNDLDTLDIIRRITRDAGSAYKANGKDVRARDVQMLFADASTGAHSPALVRQGQIAELINARPKARRRILEEAAGISGLYQRRHEAELKLNAAETNLARVDDVLEQLATQLAQLARQAKQAARYREIGTELRHAEGLLLYRRWREADEIRTLAAQALAQATTAAAHSEAEARKAAKAREEIEGDLPAAREEDAIAGALLQRLRVERDTLDAQEEQAHRTIATLEARLTQMTQDMEREIALNADAEGTIARLHEEREQLDAASVGHDDTLDAASDAAREAATVLQDREAELAEMTEDTARLSARHQSAHRTLEDARKTLGRNEAEAKTALLSLEEAKQAETSAKAAQTTAEAASQEATTAAQVAETALFEADAARQDVQKREADARAHRSEAEGEASALRAEASALARLVERETGEGNQLLDAVQVQTGFEKALGAALADDLRSPEIDADQITGWAKLPAYANQPLLPDGASPLSDYVQIPDVLARRMAQVGLVEAADGTKLQSQLSPGQRLVSKEGDLWRWDGFRTGAEDVPSAAALRLQQLNRLEELKRNLEEASAHAEGARQAHEHLTQQLSDLTETDKKARDARRDADRNLADASRAQSRAEGDRALAAGRAETLQLSATRYAEEAQSAREQVQSAEAGLHDLGDLEAARSNVEQIKTAVEAARITMISKRSAHDELRREGEARRTRSAEIESEVSSWKTRLDTASRRMADLTERKQLTEEELDTARQQPEVLVTKRDALGSSIDEAEARRKAASDKLALTETRTREATQSERDAERTASDAREARARADARAEAALETVTLAANRIAEDLDTTPAQLLDQLATDPDQMPSADRVENDVSRLKRQRDALGAVNLRAEEDARGVEEEHGALAREKGDLEAAIAKLRSGIASLNKEGRERLLTAFEQVNSSFSVLFTHLFGGGEAKLVMVESDDPLEAGLEIMCQPPGKKLSTLSLLSGGEQSLTALALIFAVFLANPAPICVLDEVDAPLDDANVARFCDLLDEMTRRTDTRFLIITHHAVTMARMDRLFGVTMGELGVSQLVSVDLQKAESMVA
ncbi:MAG: chromosome segregation protein SMC [Pseudomonadota bacterium]